MADYGILRAGTLVSAGAATLPLVGAGDTYLIETVIIQNEPSGQGPTVGIGNALICPFQLVAGASLTLNIDRLDKVFVRFPSAGRVNWLAGSK